MNDDVILKFPRSVRGVLGAAEVAGCIPEPGFEGLIIPLVIVLLPLWTWRITIWALSRRGRSRAVGSSAELCGITFSLCLGPCACLFRRARLVGWLRWGCGELARWLYRSFEALG